MLLWAPDGERRRGRPKETCRFNIQYIGNELVFFQKMSEMVYKMTYKKSQRIPLVGTAQSKIAAKILSQYIIANNCPTNWHRKAILVSKRMFSDKRNPMSYVKLISD